MADDSLLDGVVGSEGRQVGFAGTHPSPPAMHVEFEDIEPGPWGARAQVGGPTYGQPPSLEPSQRSSSRTPSQPSPRPSGQRGRRAAPMPEGVETNRPTFGAGKRARLASAPSTPDPAGTGYERSDNPQPPARHLGPSPGDDRTPGDDLRPRPRHASSSPASSNPAPSSPASSSSVHSTSWEPGPQPPDDTPGWDRSGAHATSPTSHAGSPTSHAGSPTSHAGPGDWTRWTEPTGSSSRPAGRRRRDVPPDSEPVRGSRHAAGENPQGVSAFPTATPATPHSGSPGPVGDETWSRWTSAVGDRAADDPGASARTWSATVGGSDLGAHAAERSRTDGSHRSPTDVEGSDVSPSWAVSDPVDLLADLPDVPTYRDDEPGEPTPDHVDSRATASHPRPSGPDRPGPATELTARFDASWDRGDGWHHGGAHAGPPSTSPPSTSELETSGPATRFGDRGSHVDDRSGRHDPASPEATDRFADPADPWGPRQPTTAGRHARDPGRQTPHLDSDQRPTDSAAADLPTRAERSHERPSQHTERLYSRRRELPDDYPEYLRPRGHRLPEAKEADATKQTDPRPLSAARSSRSTPHARDALAPRADERLRRSGRPTPPERGLPAWAAVLIALGSGLAVSVVDLLVTGRLSALFSLGFVLTAFGIAAGVRRSDMFTAGVLPPLAALGTFTVLAVAMPERLGDFSLPLAILVGLASKAWTLVAATALSLGTIAFRVLTRRDEDDPDDLNGNEPPAGPSAARAARRRSSSRWLSALLRAAGNRAAGGTRGRPRRVRQAPKRRS